MTVLITGRDQAVAFLDKRIDRGIQPGLERIAGLLAVMGDPHRHLPMIHVAGTNGKTTTVRLITDILGHHGLKVGSFISPHLERVEERFSIGGVSLDEEQFAAAVADVAPFVEAYEQRHDLGVTYFELTAAIAFAVFVGHAADVGVVEVGMGGRWDATNVVEADVSVITGIALDHTTWLGGTIAEIAAEKVAILKRKGRLVTGVLPATADGAVTARVAETESRWFRYGEHFAAAEVGRAIGGWVCDVDGTFDRYEGIFLPLHGRHQVDHLATAVAVCEVFFGRALDHAAVLNAVAGASSPGRIEVISRKPLVLIDGAHNAQGLHGLATALADEFLPGPRILVAGFGGDRDPAPLLAPLVGLVDRVIATSAADGKALPAEQVAAAAAAVFGPEVLVEVRTPVAAAVAAALAAAAPSDTVVVTGSLYVVGEARTALTTSDRRS
ncbi:MAG: bifunctional folylpolyglutamate synthase/dihydrofolate synthase [Acidimicrobiia bacterium]